MDHVKNLCLFSEANGVPVVTGGRDADLTPSGDRCRRRRADENVVHVGDL
jgi:hypothetical protein